MGHSSVTSCKGGSGVIQISSDSRYDGAWSNVISVTRGCVGVKFAEKKTVM